ncbi:MAG: aminotransferase class V-fold PLP-dependent enzyme [Dehalococcoidia bacterium]|jgi:isopenicillin-N epimerase|nr:aminotransferase class V-fold PLP-dependent enzyme [Dehalococcoidia bacterium]
MTASSETAGTNIEPFWALDPDVTYLNHGSFGATPRPVLERQQSLRDELEREPIDFLSRSRERRIDEARKALADFVGASASGLAFVPNATTGVNSVLRSLRFEAGDELVVTDHAYNACRNALDFVAERWGATVSVAPLPFPLASPDEIVDAVAGALTARTRLAMIDHVTSPTALVLPLPELVSAIAGRGVEVLVDGAHAPGMVELDLDELATLGMTYYAGNCHKWLCAPKGAGFLWVAPGRQPAIRPTVISHGANRDTSLRSRFHLEFDWTGTTDFTPWLCVPTAIEAVGGRVEGGWAALRLRNHELALAARDLLTATLGIATPPCPDEMVGSMAALPLADAGGVVANGPDTLSQQLRDQFGLEVPVMPWRSPRLRLLRVSAQLYNTRADFERLADALRALSVTGANSVR